MNKVLVIGGSGCVGKAIVAKMNKCDEFDVYATYFNNPIPLNENKSFKLNIEDVNNINDILNFLKPNIVVSCLRGNYDKQLIVHTKIAEYLRKNHGRLYFCSTTNVFDSDFSRAHYEDDSPNSITEYGQFKIECENIITEILHHNACILRLPQVWGKDSPRMKELLNLLNNNEKSIVYPKLIINTITDVMIAEKVFYIIKYDLKGIFHLAAEDVINYKDFYNELIIGLGFSEARIEENFKEEGYFAILSKRNNGFPDQLRLTNKSMITYLINS
ncbi:sugar nucleotide-binding protein [Clostridium sp. P21]|uniref:dTDP-4-dehydrorhamnose reductase n=1 Tax=Clostridium muellerianum TaxID=2716538 RepID=A0A7Y0EFM0_9CLOT|nr:sugar nucleotide-binding protein [Clostridium muellerianum]NMM62570.1 sugar nucleotide-binding protein [Clostridium muellerianum]